MKSYLPNKKLNLLVSDNWMALFFLALNNQFHQRKVMSTSQNFYSLFSVRTGPTSRHYLLVDRLFKKLEIKVKLDTYTVPWLPCSFQLHLPLLLIFLSKVSVEGSAVIQ